MRTFVAGAVIAPLLFLLALLAAAARSARNEPENGFVKACGAAIVERMPAFKTTSVKRSEEPMSVEKLLEGDPIAIESNRNAKAITHIALFRDEDASGTKTIRCTDGTLEGEEPTGISAMVKVDGLTRFQWLAQKRD